MYIKIDRLHTTLQPKQRTLQQTKYMAVSGNEDNKEHEGLNSGHLG